MNEPATKTVFVAKRRVDGATVKMEYAKVGDLIKSLRTLLDNNDQVRIRVAKRIVKVRAPKAKKEKATIASQDEDDDAAIEAALAV